MNLYRDEVIYFITNIQPSVKIQTPNSTSDILYISIIICPISNSINIQTKRLNDRETNKQSAINRNDATYRLVSLKFSFCQFGLGIPIKLVFCSNTQIVSDQKEQDHEKVNRVYLQLVNDCSGELTQQGGNPGEQGAVESQGEDNVQL